MAQGQLGPFAWAPLPQHTPPNASRPQPAPDSFSCFPKYSGHWTAYGPWLCCPGGKQTRLHSLTFSIPLWE